LGVDMIRFFEGSRAEVDQTFELEGAISKLGRLTASMVKREGEWLIEHARLLGPSAHLWDSDPVLQQKPEDPPYPAEAAEHHVQGKVVLDILVRLDGSTEVVEVLEGLPHGCNEMAMEHARLWRWRPATRNGQPVEASGEIWVRCGPPPAPGSDR
jgi:TonB family protein